MNVSQIAFTITSSSKTLLPSGPYFIYDNGIYQAWRLYPDDLDAFEFSVTQEIINGVVKYDSTGCSLWCFSID